MATGGEEAAASTGREGRREAAAAAARTRTRSRLPIYRNGRLFRPFPAVASSLGIFLPFLLLVVFLFSFLFLILIADSIFLFISSALPRPLFYGLGLLLTIGCSPPLLNPSRETLQITL